MTRETRQREDLGAMLAVASHLDGGLELFDDLLPICGHGASEEALRALL
jgi:hypothetical protein